MKLERYTMKIIPYFAIGIGLVFCAVVGSVIFKQPRSNELSAVLSGLFVIGVFITLSALIVLVKSVKGSAPTQKGSTPTQLSNKDRLSVKE